MPGPQFPCVPRHPRSTPPPPPHTHTLHPNNCAQAGSAASGGLESAESDADETAFAKCRPVVPLIAGGMGAGPGAGAAPMDTDGDAAAAAAASATAGPAAAPPAGGVAAPATPSISGQDGAAAAPARAPLRCHCHVLYASEPLFVLLRLHCLLYERLRTARQCAVSASSGASFAVGPAGPHPGGAAWTPAAAALHARYLDLARQLVEGRLEPGAYEDATRALLGTNSYQLFTLDKVVAKAVRQAALVAADELAGKLVELWRYECARGLPTADAVYHANARVLVHDEPAFRVEVEAGTRAVRVHLLDADRLEVPLGVLDPAFREYVEGYVHGAAGADAPVRVCLARSLAAGGAGAAAEPALPPSVLVNGLECKLCCVAQQKKKVAYVLGTEDCFYRTPRRGSKSGTADARDARSAKFRRWVEERSAAGAALDQLAAAAPAAAAAGAAAGEDGQAHEPAAPQVAQGSWQDGGGGDAPAPQEPAGREEEGETAQAAALLAAAAAGGYD
uniref:Sin3 C-terminal domain-containing protein n=1 Tax=Auxenochlorella protothecoides TaxID=3075 RepID=A0A1D1ZV95_AUXPR